MTSNVRAIFASVMIGQKLINYTSWVINYLNDRCIYIVRGERRRWTGLYRVPVPLTTGPTSPYCWSLSRGYFRPADCLGCSILGMYLFGGKFCMWADRSRPCTCAEVVSRHPMCRCDRKHFNDIVWALVTVFQVPLFLPLLKLYHNEFFFTCLKRHTRIYA